MYNAQTKIYRTGHDKVEGCRGLTTKFSTTGGVRGMFSFFTMKRSKTYLLNTTSENRLNGLALLNIYREIKLQKEDDLNKLATKTRRIRLL